jgi:yersiniabactin salicyl-AMP ligase
MADNLRKKGPGLLNGIEMIAVNHHRACNVAQPLTPGIDLLRLAEVQDCAVVAAPDTLLGERICAFIIAQQVPTDYQQLRQQLTRMGLSAWKIPDQIEFLDHWPLTAVGKIDKKRLTALAVDRYRHSAQ